MNYIRFTTLLITLTAPLLASAQGNSFDNLLTTLRSSLNTVIIFLFLVATVIFLWGVVRYISAGGEEDKASEARNMIIWGIIFLAVMVAVWGFVYVVLDFVRGTEGPVPIPGVGGVPRQ